jgi:hypothetical protein
MPVIIKISLADRSAGPSPVFLSTTGEGVMLTGKAVNFASALGDITEYYTPIWKPPGGLF